MRCSQRVAGFGLGIMGSGMVWLARLKGQQIGWIERLSKGVKIANVVSDRSVAFWNRVTSSSSLKTFQGMLQNASTHLAN